MEQIKKFVSSGQVSVWQNYCKANCMNLSILASFSLTLASLFNQIEYNQLIGSWQLTHFEGMEKLISSSQYQNANSMERASMDARIKFRLENTVYQFEVDQVMKFTDFENQQVVQKEARVELLDGSVLVMHEEKGDRSATIIELTDQKMVLQPISTSSVSGKLIFERIN